MVFGKTRAIAQGAVRSAQSPNLVGWALLAKPQQTDPRKKGVFRFISILERLAIA
ncbi:hypothetical protein [Scytonema sp. PCC 10023]|uniref:hypothetical protein n=1 Tax=Scytonema sp. PCC 10023 TaxID=1680591 RepID=UPI0039C60079